MKAVTEKNSFDISFDNESHTSGSINTTQFLLDIIETGKDKMHVLHNNNSYTVEVKSKDHQNRLYTLVVNGNEYNINLKNQLDLQLEQMGMTAVAGAKAENIKAPMPGLVLNIDVAVGQHVEKGDPVLILEAMKMENVIKSPSAGIVKSIDVEKGQAVEKNHVLITFES